MTDSSYKNWISMSDKALAGQVGKFIQHERLRQNKSQDVLSAEAGISRSTLSLLERGEPVMLATLLQVLRVLGQLQLMDAFLVEESISPLALARAEKEKRQRARKGSKGNKPKTDW